MQLVVCSRNSCLTGSVFCLTELSCSTLNINVQYNTIKLSNSLSKSSSVAVVLTHQCQSCLKSKSGLHKWQDRSGPKEAAAIMSWKRLPTFFANIPLKLMPLTEGQQKAFETSGSLKQVAFQTIPSVSKVTRRILVHADCSAAPVVLSGSLC